MIDEPIDTIMQARLARLLAQLARDLKKKNRELANVPNDSAIYKPATDPPKTLDDVKDCLR